MRRQQDIAEIASLFGVEGAYAGSRRIESGHIHDTYLVDYSPGSHPQRIILQRINTGVFPDPEAVMANLLTLKEYASSAVDRAARVIRMPEPIVSHSGVHIVRDRDNGPWRALSYVDGNSLASAVSTRHASAAAEAFGHFQATFLDLAPDALVETIPRFHDTPHRFSSFETAVNTDIRNRARSSLPEIEFAAERRSLCSILTDLSDAGQLPTRVVHNDAKISNIIFTRAGKPPCIIDLDTVMPGYSLCDFGDMVRSMTCRSAEDERDLGKVRVDPELFSAVAQGYLRVAAGFLTHVERHHLLAAARLIAFETGLRFLTDYLCGDTYFRVQRPAQNLDRCRAQFSLVEDLETRDAEFSAILSAFSDQQE